MFQSPLSLLTVQGFKIVDPALADNILLPPMLKLTKGQREMSLPLRFNPPGVNFVHNFLARVLCEKMVAPTR